MRNRTHANILKGNGNIQIVGDNIAIINGEIFANGKNITPTDIGPDERTINITITGDVASIKSDHGQINVQGNVAKLKTETGDVEVHGRVDSVATMSGNVSCGEDADSIVTTTGNVRISGNVHGKVSTITGNIRS